MSNAYTSRLIPEPTLYTSPDVTEEVYVFALDKQNSPRTTNIVEYFYFIDMQGIPVAATAGEILIQGSSDNGVTYQDFQEGLFEASTSLSPSRLKTSGIGKCTHCKITLNGVVTAGVSFTMLFNQITGV